MNIDINKLIADKVSPEREAKYKKLLEVKLETMDKNDPIIKAVENKLKEMSK